jgi:hypothetical protein
MDLLKSIDWQREIALPLAILSVPIAISGLFVGEALTLAFPVAFLIGLLLRPRRLWLLWLASIVLLWAIYGFITLADLFEGEEEGGETIWSFAFESFIFFALLVLLPAWLGRLLGSYIDRRREGLPSSR